MSTTNSLPIPTSDPPRKRSIFKTPSGMDFTLYDDAYPSMIPFTEDAIDLEDITKKGVSKAFNFAQQEYKPMFHPFDAQGAYPQPFEWETMFDDLGSPQRTRSPSVISISSTAPAPGSRKGSIQLSQPSSRHNSCVETPVRSCGRSSQYLTNKRLSVLLSNFSLLPGDSSSQADNFCRCRSQDLESARTSRTSLSVSTTPTSRTGSYCRKRSKNRRKSYSSTLLLAHVGEGHTPYRMDSHSQDLQKIVAGIPISAFIHPKMHIPASNDYGPVEEEGGYQDAYPLRLTRLWSFDEPGLPVERCVLDRYEREALGEGLSPFAMAGVV